MPLTPLLAQVQEDQVASRSRSAAQQIPSPIVQQNLSHATLAMFLMEGVGVPKADACEDGQHDASDEQSGVLWFILGFVTMPYGIVAAYVISPSPTESKLKGKTASYISAYTDCYKDTARGIHTKWAWIGCGTVFALAMIVVLAVMFLSPHTGKLGD